MASDGERRGGRQSRGAILFAKGMGSLSNSDLGGGYEFYTLLLSIVKTKVQDQPSWKDIIMYNIIPRQHHCRREI